jgi:hypothetical protein
MRAAAAPRTVSFSRRYSVTGAKELHCDFNSIKIGYCEWCAIAP